MQTQPAETTNAQLMLDFSSAIGAAQPTQTTAPAASGNTARHSGRNCGTCPCRGLCRRNRNH